MNTSRRSFLKGILSVSAVAVIGIPSISEALPILYSDGINDDFPALDAILRRKKIIVEGQCIATNIGERVLIDGGNFFLSQSLKIDATIYNVTIQNCRFRSAKGMNAFIGMQL